MPYAIRYIFLILFSYAICHTLYLLILFSYFTVFYCLLMPLHSLTPEDGSVTVRERDSMQQTRMKIDDVFPFMSKMIDGI
jgi:hypothetical protein